MAVNPSTPIEQGKAAAAQGKTGADNPYEAGSQESADWLDGFTDAADITEDVERDDKP